MQEFDREYKEKFDSRKYKSDYDWLKINTTNKGIEDKVKDEVVKHCFGKKYKFISIRQRATLIPKTQENRGGKEKV